MFLTWTASIAPSALSLRDCADADASTKVRHRVNRTCESAAARASSIGCCPLARASKPCLMRLRPLHGLIAKRADAGRATQVRMGDEPQFGAYIRQGVADTSDSG